jgi:endoglucanase
LARTRNFIRLLPLIPLVPVLAASGCGVFFPSSDKEPPPITEVWEVHPVRADSVGYITTRQKRVTIVLPAGMTTLADAAADVRDESTDTVVWSCTVEGPMTDAATGSTYYVGDFTPFTSAGTYYIAVPSLTTPKGIARSAPFKIAPDVFRDLLKYALVGGFYAQRCGIAVNVNLGGQSWSHGVCHQGDASQKYLTSVMMDTIKPSLRGWHDAGDYGKYVTNGAFTVGMLLQAWERFQPTLAALSLPIPEHGGTIPDFLAEVKWELDWLLTTQIADGSVSFKVTGEGFEGFVVPEEDGARRYYTGISTHATADFAAAFAQASRIYRMYDATLADSYLAAARLAYTFLQANPGNKRVDLSMFSTGQYDACVVGGNCPEDWDNRLWASAELWATTGEAAYLTDFESVMTTKMAGTSFQPVPENFDWDNVANMGVFSYLLSTQPGRTQTMVDALTAATVASANALASRANAAAFGRAISGYWWGSNGAVVRTSMNLWVGGLLSPGDADRFTDAIAMQLDHLLGRNIYDRTQVTGVGYHPPIRPHHRPSIADNAANPWPGLLVGGANPGANDWKDDADDAALNEIAVNWNAPLIFAAAALTPAP